MPEVREHKRMIGTRWLTVMALLLLVARSGLLVADSVRLFEKTQHDFGPVPMGTLLVQRFRWTNSTSAPVTITQVQTSSNSVQVRLLPQTLEPGASGYVEVEMDTRQFAGENVVAVRLQLQPGPRHEILQVRAVSRPDVVIRPGMVRFAGLEAGETAERLVEVEYSGSLDWQILAGHNPYPFLTTQIRLVSRRPGETRYQIAIRLNEQAPVGNWLAVLTLSTNDPGLPVFPILVEGQIRPVIEVSATPAVFVENGRADSEQRVILRGLRPFRIVAIAEKPPGTEVEPVSDRPQPIHLLIVRRQAQADVPKNAVIRVATDCPQQPVLEIPITNASHR
jgi:hypothetical protein